MNGVCVHACVCVCVCVCMCVCVCVCVCVHLFHFDSSLLPLSHMCSKHYEQCPVVPLKILAHNELVGRVIGEKEMPLVAMGRGEGKGLTLL